MSCVTRNRLISWILAICIAYLLSWLMLITMNLDGRTKILEVQKSYGTELHLQIHETMRALKNVTPKSIHNDQLLKAEVTSAKKNITLITSNSVPTKSNTTNSTANVVSKPTKKSVIFLKSFKVGGTTMATMLTAYAFNKELNLGKVDGFCRGRLTKAYGKCVDVLGTNHPRTLPCNYPRINSPSLCNPAEVFLMIREPTERLWSGYKHEVRIASGFAFPLSRFLESKSIVKTPSHHLLSKDVKRALARTADINILLHHLYDESLVYMAEKAGLAFCDIMYVPCQKASWSATKCNGKISVNMTEQDRSDLLKEATTTGEMEFYNNLVNKAERNIKTDHIIKLTKAYQEKREKLLAKCLEPRVLDHINEMMKKNRYVRRGTPRRDKASAYTQLVYYQTELANPLDPLVVCLGYHCNQEM